MVLSRVVSEIFNVEKYRDLEIPVKGQSRSLNVVSFNSIYILVFYRNFVFEIFDFKNDIIVNTGLEAHQMSP